MSGPRVKGIRSPGGSKRRGYTFVCPGCSSWHAERGSPNDFRAWHMFHTEPWARDGKKGPVWTFNGDMERPTFSPSLLIFRGEYDDGEVGHPRCHLFVRDGKIEYCSDSEHKLAGKTVDMEPVE